MPTSLICMRSRTLRMTSIGHGEPAMMPVRRLERSKRSNSECSSSAMNMVGTPCKPVQRSASTVRSAGEIAHHHAEAMIKRHRNQQPVAFAQAHGEADEIGVVEDVAVGERG